MFRKVNLIKLFLKDQIETDMHASECFNLILTTDLSNRQARKLVKDFKQSQEYCQLKASNYMTYTSPKFINATPEFKQTIHTQNVITNFDLFIQFLSEYSKNSIFNFRIKRKSGDSLSELYSSLYYEKLGIIVSYYEVQRMIFNKEFSILGKDLKDSPYLIYSKNVFQKNKLANQELDNLYKYVKMYESQSFENVDEFYHARNQLN